MKVTISKTLFTSKTFWVNLVAIAAIVSQYVVGFEVFPMEAQAGILALVNAVLRLATRKPIVWDSIGELQEKTKAYRSLVESGFIVRKTLRKRR